MRNKGIIYTIIGAILWGLSGTVSQAIMQNYQLSPIMLTSIRMLMSGILICSILIATNAKKNLEIIRKKDSLMQLTAFAIVGLLFNQLAYLQTIKYTNSGTATVLQYIGPVFLLIYYCLRGRRLPNRRESFAIAFTIIGVLLITTHGQLDSLALSTEGLIFGLLSAVALAFYHVLPTNLMRHYSALQVTGFGMLIGGTVLSFITQPWQMLATSSIEMIGLLIFVIIFGTVLPYSLYLKGIQDIGPLPASLIGTVEPLSATVFTILLLGTQFVFLDFIGFGFILATIVLTAHE